MIDNFLNNLPNEKRKSSDLMSYFSLALVIGCFIAQPLFQSVKMIMAQDQRFSYEINIKNQYNRLLLFVLPKSPYGHLSINFFEDLAKEAKRHIHVPDYVLKKKMSEVAELIVDHGSKSEYAMEIIMSNLVQQKLKKYKDDPKVAHVKTMEDLKKFLNLGPEANQMQVMEKLGISMEDFRDAQLPVSNLNSLLKSIGASQHDLKRAAYDLAAVEMFVFICNQNNNTLIKMFNKIASSIPKYIKYSMMRKKNYAEMNFSEEVLSRFSESIDCKEYKDHTVIIKFLDLIPNEGVRKKIKDNVLKIYKTSAKNFFIFKENLNKELKSLWKEMNFTIEFSNEAGGDNDIIVPLEKKDNTTLTEIYYEKLLAEALKEVKKGLTYREFLRKYGYLFDEKKEMSGINIENKNGSDLDKTLLFFCEKDRMFTMKNTIYVLTGVSQEKIQSHSKEYKKILGLMMETIPYCFSGKKMDDMMLRRSESYRSFINTLVNYQDKPSRE